MSKFVVNIGVGWGNIRNWFRGKTCSHRPEHLTFLRNLTPPEISLAGGMRSVWRCRDCGGDVYQAQSFHE